MRSNQVIELVKWLIGTVGIAVTGILINQKIQSTELEVKRLEADAKFLEVVTADIGADVINSEIKYLEYILTFVTTTQIRKEIQERIMRKKALLIEEESLVIKLKAEVRKNALKTELNPEQIKAFELKKSEEALVEPSEPQKNMDSLLEEENAIAPNIKSLNWREKSIDSLQKVTTPVSIVDHEDDFNIIGVPITKWCKKGYYVEFSQHLRIGVKKLIDKSISINLKDISESSDDPAILKDNVKIIEGEVWVGEFNNYRYEITLNYIGAAGKNPFTKAACLTVSTYKKAITE